MKHSNCVYLFFCLITGDVMNFQIISTLIFLITQSKSSFITNYGSKFGDTSLPPNENDCYKINLDFQFTFFNQKYTFLHLCTDGYALLNGTKSRLGIYELDFSLSRSKGGSILFRNVRDSSTLNAINTQVNVYSGDRSNFLATNAYLITFLNLPYAYNPRLKCTFQLVLVKDSFNSYLIFNYLLTSQAANFTRILDAYNSANNIQFKGNKDSSNYQDPGSFVFRVQQSTIINNPVTKTTTSKPLVPSSSSSTYEANYDDARSLNPPNCGQRLPQFQQRSESLKIVGGNSLFSMFLKRRSTIKNLTQKIILAD